MGSATTSQSCGLGWTVQGCLRVLPSTVSPALCHQHWARGGGCLLPQPSPTTGDSVGQVTLSENQGVVLWICARFGVLGAIPHVPGGWVDSTVG